MPPADGAGWFRREVLDWGQAERTAEAPLGALQQPCTVRSWCPGVAGGDFTPPGASRRRCRAFRKGTAGR